MVVTINFCIAYATRFGYYWQRSALVAMHAQFICRSRECTGACARIRQAHNTQHRLIFDFFSSHEVRIQLDTNRYVDMKTEESVVCFPNSDWASDKVTRRSTSGVLLLADGAPVAWNSHSQTIIAIRSQEAEYCAMAAAAKSVLYLQILIANVRIRQSPNLHVTANLLW